MISEPLGVESDIMLCEVEKMFEKKFEKMCEKNGKRNVNLFTIRRSLLVFAGTV